MFVPLTVKGKAEAPAVAPDCERKIFVGAAGVEGEIVKGIVLETTPRFDTSIFTLPAEAIKFAGRTAVNCTGLTKLVASGVTVAVPDGGDGGTTQSTTDPVTKFVPFTVRMTPGGLHAGVEDMEVAEDDKDVIVGATMLKLCCDEGIAPGFTNWMFVVPKLARSLAGTVATREAGSEADAGGT